MLLGNFALPCATLVNHRQKRGKMNKNGASSGIAKRLNPQVQMLIQMATSIVISIENEIIKHPPFMG